MWVGCAGQMCLSMYVYLFTIVQLHLSHFECRCKFFRLMSLVHAGGRIEDIDHQGCKPRLHKGSTWDETIGDHKWDAFIIPCYCWWFRNPVNSPVEVIYSLSIAIIINKSFSLTLFCVAVCKSWTLEEKNVETVSPKSFDAILNHTFYVLA